MNALSLKEESFFSYLPLCHIAERLLVMMGSLYTGGRVYFAESLDTFADANSKTTFTEGEGLTINVATTGYTEGENFYYKIIKINNY